VETALGTLWLTVRGQALTELRFGDAAATGEDPAAASRDPAGFASRARAWFAGDLAAFDGALLDPAGTPFQRAVWALVRAIPAGETRSYGALAAQLGNRGASRAVGAANGANPICIAIPCHRVVGANGALTGYAWGLDRKRWLLAHERRAIGRQER
jgi:methylated-DNA-[protein]-cysteine S-methyltransferase